MNSGILSLLVPLAVGFHPAARPTTPTLGCAPGMTSCVTPMSPGMPMSPWQTACPPLGPPAPLLAMKVVTPPGVRVTSQPGSAEAKIFSAPVVLGFRPGYVYRLELAGLRGHPNAVLHPEIEVRGSLVPRPGMNYMEYPAAIQLSDGDIERALSGALITKVIYLEDPVRAPAISTTVDKPLELISSVEDDALRDASENGRIVAIVRIGNRRLSPEELSRNTVTGTVLTPGEGALGPPSAHPKIHWGGVPLYDPILGPRISSEECFTDGGDTGPRLGLGQGLKLGGLNSTDVGVEYSHRGIKKVTTSNQVCVCVPRFAVQRVDTGLQGMQLALRVEAGVQRFQTGNMVDRRHTDSIVNRIKPVATEGSQRLAGQVGSQQVFTMLGAVGPAKAYAVVQGVQVVVSSVEPDETTNADGLVVTKEVTPKSGVKIGDEVTFTLKFSNKTGDPITDLILSDSLSPRLEYVSGSAQSDRPVNVSSEANESGSTIVRFEVPGALQPGQAGIVRFRAKVR